MASIPINAARKEALELALSALFVIEPGDSRAVSDEFVAMATLLDDSCTREEIQEALRIIRQGNSFFNNTKINIAPCRNSIAVTIVSQAISQVHIDYAPIARKLLEAAAITLNSPDGVTLEDSIRQIANDETEAEFLTLASHWDNDIMNWAEVDFGYKIEEIDGVNVVVEIKKGEACRERIEQETST